MTTYRGRSLERLEDAHLLRGAGQFVDDMQLDGMLHAAVVRSTHAHAYLKHVDVSKARAADGVELVLTGADLDGKIDPIGAIRREGMGETPIPAHPVLAHERVYYVGQPVAIVFASDRYAAKDAAALVEVTYDPLPPLTNARDSAAAKEPLHPHIGSNVVMRAAAGTGDVGEAFEQADRIVKGTYEVPRLVATPMETRGLVVSHDTDADELTMWTSTQVPHRVKTYLKALLPQRPTNVRVIAPDVGGGFGRKIEVWPEEVASAYAAIELGKPIKWSEERSENLVASHGRGFTGDVEAAVKEDGTILGLRFRMLADMGAFFLTSSGGPLGNAVQRVAGPYAVQAMDVECLGVVTNKPPTGPYRGAGGPEAAVLIERIVDTIAAELAIDPAELRRRNFIGNDAFPYTTATGLTYDSGDFQTAFDRALTLAEYADVRRKQGAAKADVVTGIGIATVVKASGGKANVRQSNARIEISSRGHVDVITDVSPHGQGTETSFAQIAADALGVSIDDVEVHHGDTDLLENGGGTTSSRGLAVGGNAIYTALEQVGQTLKETAAGMLRCAVEDVWFAERRAYSKLDFHAAVDFQDVVRTAIRRSGEPGPLTVEVSYTLPANPFAFAAHIAVVNLDRGTGDVGIERFVAVHDCGPMINPMIVRGQIQGGITQGIGQAMSEGVGYDTDGAPFQTNLMTYGVPNSESTPAYVLENLETPSPTNPLGIKGIGELPTVASPVAVANAVADALAQVGVSADGLDMPITQEQVWRVLIR